MKEPNPATRTTARCDTVYEASTGKRSPALSRRVTALKQHQPNWPSPSHDRSTAPTVKLAALMATASGSMSNSKADASLFSASENASPECSSLAKSSNNHEAASSKAFSTAFAGAVRQPLSNALKASAHALAPCRYPLWKASARSARISASAKQSARPQRTS